MEQVKTRGEQWKQALEQAPREVWCEKAQRNCRERIPDTDITDVDIEIEIMTAIDEGLRSQGGGC